jgi:hypothetical protein
MKGHIDYLSLKVTEDMSLAYYRILESLRKKNSEMLKELGIKYWRLHLYTYLPWYLMGKI